MEENRGVFSHFSGIIRIVVFAILVIIIAFFVIRFFVSRQNAQKAEEASKTAATSKDENKQTNSNDQSSSSTDSSQKSNGNAQSNNSTNNSSSSQSQDNPTVQIPNGIADSDASNPDLPGVGMSISAVTTTFSLSIAAYAVFRFAQSKQALRLLEAKKRT